MTALIIVPITTELPLLSEITGGVVDDVVDVVVDVVDVVVGVGVGAFFGD